MFKCTVSNVFFFSIQKSANANFILLFFYRTLYIPSILVIMKLILKYILDSIINYGFLIPEIILEFSYNYFNSQIYIMILDFVKKMIYNSLKQLIQNISLLFVNKYF